MSSSAVKTDVLTSVGAWLSTPHTSLSEMRKSVSVSFSASTHHIFSKRFAQTNHRQVTFFRQRTWHSNLCSKSVACSWQISDFRRQDFGAFLNRLEAPQKLGRHDDSLSKAIHSKQWCKNRIQFNNILGVRKMIIPGCWPVSSSLTTGTVSSSFFLTTSVIASKRLEVCWRAWHDTRKIIVIVTLKFWNCKVERTYSHLLSAEIQRHWHKCFCTLIIFLLNEREQTPEISDKFSLPQHRSCEFFLPFSEVILRQRCHSASYHRRVPYQSLRWSYHTETMHNEVCKNQ